MKDKDMHACHPRYAAMIEALANGELPAQQEEELRNHAECCEACGEELWLLEIMEQELDMDEELEHFNEEVWGRIHARQRVALTTPGHRTNHAKAWWRHAAAALFILTAWSIWTLLPTWNQEPAVTTVSSESRHESTSDQLVQDLLLLRNLGEDLDLLSPEDCAQEIAFLHMLK